MVDRKKKRKIGRKEGKNEGRKEERLIPLNMEVFSRPCGKVMTQ
jgi:hypothetical protein